MILNYILFGFLGLVVLLFLFYKFWFLRDPQREVPKGKSIVSPADGKVIAIQKYNLHDKTITKGKFGKIHTNFSKVAPQGYYVSIFMSPLDVHVNRSPIPGKVTHVKHTAGKFIAAYKENAWVLNEKTEIVIKGKSGSIMVILIAGALARRITTFVAKGTVVTRGQRIGMITMGSQATLIVPKHMSIKVKLGQRVLAGQSIIAEEK